LRDSPLASALNDLLGRTGCHLDVDLGKGKVMFRQKALCDAAVGAPKSRINFNVHERVLIQELDDT
jgi:hypothetical protein